MRKENTSLNIGIVCYPTHGGSGVVAVELAHGLAERGHNLHVISYARPPRLDTARPRIDFHCVRVPDYPLFEYPPYSLALAARLAEVICEYKLDILHVHYAIPHAVSGWLARRMTERLDLPLITTLHGTDITIVGNDTSYKPITRHSLEVSDRVTVVSRWLAGEVKEKLECRCEPQVVYNFVDTELFNPGGSSRLREKFSHPAPIILHMSNFRPVKRICDIVHGFLLLREQVHAHLVLVGDGPERIRAERRLKDSPYRDDVQFLGSRNHAEEILPCADLFLLPSNAESFGLSALEAMACGVPVVGADAGGLPEVVRNRKDGLLVPPENPAALAEACLAIMNDSELRQEMSRNARARAEMVFPRGKAISCYEELYRSTIELVRKEGYRDNNARPSEC